MSYSLIHSFGPMRHVNPRNSGHIVFVAGGGGGKAPTDQTVRQISLPKFAEPYYERMLAGAEQALNVPYAEYTGDRVARGADISDIAASREAVRNISGAGIPGAELAGAAFERGLGALQSLGQYAPGQFTATQVSPYAGFQAGAATPFEDFRATEVTPYSDFREAQFSPFEDFSAGQAEAYQFDPTRQFTGEEVERYMSPYIQNVLDRQMAEARRQFDIGRASRATRAIQSSAFGGSRAAVQEALAEEAMARQQGDIYAGGMQSAFESAMGAFQSDRAAQAAREAAQASELARAQGINIGEAARVQESLAGERARVEAARAAEAARVQASQAAELARTQGISVEEAARIQASRAAEQARVQGINIGEAARIQAAQAAELARTQGISVSEAARVQAAQEASRQFGAGQALAAEQAALGAAEGIFGLGERQRAADIQGAQLMEAIGKDQLAEEQALRDLEYQQFLEQRDYPFQQYERMANILTGLPAGFDVSTQTYQQYNPTQQALGAGITGLGLYNAYAR